MVERPYRVARDRLSHPLGKVALVQPEPNRIGRT
jgi:hypothetical protein